MIDLDDLKSLTEEHLVLSNSILLGVAKPPYVPGVYALFYESERVYIGVARGARGLRNRKRNYVGGDDGHTTHREFLALFPEKRKRTAFIKANVSMAWVETNTAKIAETLEAQLIWLLQPKWNRLGVTKP